LWQGLIKSDEGLRQLREEIYIMCQLDHPNIVRLEEVYESNNGIYLVQELCLGGELFDRLDEQPDYHYTEQQCARLVKEMLSAVRYIHSKGIVHRDLKLENFLFSTREKDSELKMIDFGLSKHFNIGEMHCEAVGTPYTVAPEVISGRYDERCDVWAIGVITYLLLSGDSPFGGCGGPEPLHVVKNNILDGKFSFEPVEIWGEVTSDAKNFIKNILVTDPIKRFTVKQAQGSVWLTSYKEGNKTSTHLNPNVVNALVSFKEYSEMRKLLCEVLSFTLIPEQIQDLRKEFEKMDTDGSGEITLQALKKVLLKTAVSGNLGGLTEEEVEDIFNAMRVRKSDATIQWHEFIAAGLSQCKVDDRNLQLAFDRMDSEHKGYINLDNVMDLLGSNGVENGRDAIQMMFEDCLKSCNAENARITYDDFLLLMKGQTREPHKSDNNDINKKPRSGSWKLKKTQDNHTHEPVGHYFRCSKSVNDLDNDDKGFGFGQVNETFVVGQKNEFFNEEKKIINGPKVTPLIANSSVYRANREFRLNVLEASKRFEEMQQQRMAKNGSNDNQSRPKNVSPYLVLRHGLNKENSDVEQFLNKIRETQNPDEQEKRLSRAQSRSGRGNRVRDKVVSDLAGMMLPCSSPTFSTQLTPVTEDKK